MGKNKNKAEPKLDAAGGQNESLPKTSPSDTETQRSRDEVITQGNTALAQDETPAEPRKTAFWDSYLALGLMVAAILFGRYFVIEPFKIPTGSMEPELIGHEDYGDRIGTNKLAYVTSLTAMEVMGGTAAIILGGFACWYLYTRAQERMRIVRAALLTVLLMILIVGGMGFEWSQGAIADEPHRFDVVVFQYDKAWGGEKPEKQNYIKRLIGLPGENIAISGGDLFKLNRTTEKYEIIRKWQTSKALQDSLWYPISTAWSVPEIYKSKDPSKEQKEQLALLAFPWEMATENPNGAKLSDNSLALDGTGDLKLSYKFPASNIYMKKGPWPFVHRDCPALKGKETKSPNGVVWGSDKPTDYDFMFYVTGAANGVQCPLCKEILFPVRNVGRSLGSGTNVNIAPARQTGPKSNFCYGGDQTVGDLKMVLELNVEQPGTIQLEIGSDLHSSLWKIPCDAAMPDNGSVHPVQEATPALTPGKHRLSLAFVDGTVISKLDDQEAVYRIIPDIDMAGMHETSTVAKVSFSRTKATISKLDILRDLFYTSTDISQRTRSREQGIGPDSHGNFIADIPQKSAGSRVDQDYYYMMGDNSPGSSDSRFWGFVPKDQIIGRGSFIWWPPSRWRFIK